MKIYIVTQTARGTVIPLRAFRVREDAITYRNQMKNYEGFYSVNSVEMDD